MSGFHITDRQVVRYMTLRPHHPQVAAAAKAGLSERSARRIDKNSCLPSQSPKRRDWRTREDPLSRDPIPFKNHIFPSQATPKTPLSRFVAPVVAGAPRKPAPLCDCDSVALRTAGQSPCEVDFCGVNFTMENKNLTPDDGTTHNADNIDHRVIANEHSCNQSGQTLEASCNKFEYGPRMIVSSYM